MTSTNHYSLRIFYIISSLIYIFTLDANHTFDFKYTQTIQLVNKNVLFATDSGIYIYDKSFSNLENSINYPSDLTINGDADAQKITISKYSDGCVISIVKNYLYFFSKTGDVIYNEKLNDDVTEGEYYSLTPIKNNINDYYYIIGFVNSDKNLSLYYYKININTKSISLIHSYIYIPKQDDNITNTYIKEKGHSCELMYYINQNVLTCFFEIDYPQSISTVSFALSNEIQNLNLDLAFSKHYTSGSVKSSTKNDLTIALICYCGANENVKCFNYSISKNIFGEEKIYSSYCKNTPLGLNINYSPETEEFIISHLTYYPGALNIFKFDKYLKDRKSVV